MNEQWNIARRARAGKSRKEPERDGKSRKEPERDGERRDRRRNDRTLFLTAQETEKVGCKCLAVSCLFGVMGVCLDVVANVRHDGSPETHHEKRRKECVKKRNGEWTLAWKAKRWRDGDYLLRGQCKIHFARFVNNRF